MPSQDHPVALIGAMCALLLTSFLLTFVPSWLVLRFGKYRRGEHWTLMARPAYTVRTIVSSQFFISTTAVLVFSIAEELRLLPRIANCLATVLGWYVGSLLVARVLSKEYDFPRPVIALEAQRFVVLNLYTWGTLVFPLFTIGLSIELRVIASLVSIVGTAVSIVAATRLFGVFGLLEPLPADLAAAIAERAPRIRSAALRTIQANAIALPFERTILFTTGALQSLTHEELLTVTDHELSHLQEGAAVRLVRVLPRLLALTLSVTLCLTPRGDAWHAVYVLFIAVFASKYLLRRVSVAKERVADKRAYDQEPSKGDYARALEALHRAFLIPAVLPKRSTHPSLYDRLQSAGVVPDYPRPLAPSKTPVLWAVMLSAPTIIIVCFMLAG